MTHPIDLVKEAAHLTLGPSTTAGPLALIPLFGGTPAGGKYVVAAAAFAGGTLSIGELGEGTVPQLVVRNAGDLPVLLLEGEYLHGAKQDRVLNVSVLAAPRHDTVIPVACVEQGRWSYGGPHDFAPTDHFSHAAHRAMKVRDVAASARRFGARAADQGALWIEVEAQSDRVGANPSPTSAMRDAFEDRRKALDEMLREFAGPQPGQSGVLACIGGRPTALDTFDRPETLASLWERLVRGYAMDALGAASREPDRDGAERFLEGLARAEATSHEGVGLGTDVFLTGPGLVASALVWEGGVVHLATFASDEAGDRNEGWGDIAPPRSRARIRGPWFDGPPGGPPERSA